jgi:hypothetical protein
VDFLNSPLVYAIADSLMLRVKVDKRNMLAYGEGEQEVDLGGLKVIVPISIVSSLLIPEAYMVVVKLIGNLAMLVVSHVASERRAAWVAMHVLDLAKMGHVQSWLEAKKPTSAEHAVELLGHAVVKTFHRNAHGNDGWAAAA